MARRHRLRPHLRGGRGVSETDQVSRRKMSMLDAGNLPVEELAALAVREGRRPIPIYQAHRWFARRFSSAFRALLVAAELESAADFWHSFYKGVDYSGKTILDPFVGGGTSVVEAARMGASTIGIDVDPVACAITRFELGAYDIPDLNEDLESLQRKVGKRLARYYGSIDESGTPRQMLHGFWVQVINCKRCNSRIEAHPHFQLAYEAEGDRQWAFCSTCHHVHELRKDAKAFRCKRCRKRNTIGPGPNSKGKVTCPDCGTQEALIDVASRVGSPPKWKLFATETIPSGMTERCLPMTDRHFQAASAFDHDRMNAANRALRRRQTKSRGWKHIPARRIPVNGRADSRLTKYGYQHYRELFNPRQLLHLSVLAEALEEVKGPAKDAIALAFSDHLTTNCMLTNYAFGWRRLSPLFAIRAFRHVARPVEINPWLNGTGRGTFPNTARQVQRAVEFAHNPTVPHLDGGFVSSGNFSPTDDSVREIYHADSQNINDVSDGSVDLILTDPPYCDNIAYSELSDFFLPWLQSFGLAPKGPRGRPQLPQNLAASSRGSAAVAAFRTGLANCFTQMRSKLKDGGRLVFSFQHKTSIAWEALAFAMASGRWQPIQVFPLLGNSPAGLHHHNGTILWDAVIVCRKSKHQKKSELLSISDVQISQAKHHTQTWTERLNNCDAASFRIPDRENLLRATLVAASLGMFGHQRSPKVKPLINILSSE